MTLIVTAATSRFIVQVSDRRFTRSDGGLFSDDANKAVLLQCEDGVLSISYTGLGFVGKQRTDDWLVDVLLRVGASRMRAFDAIHALRDEATARLNRLILDAATKRLSIVAVGWPSVTSQANPIVATVSNFECLPSLFGQSGPDVINYSSAPSAEPAFHAEVTPVHLTPHGYYILVSGMDTTVNDPEQTLSTLGRFLSRASDALNVTRRLTGFIRQCASHPADGKYVGRNCMAVFLSDSERRCLYYGEDSSRPVGFAPHYVGPVVAFKDVIITTDRRLTRKEVERWKRGDSRPPV